MDWNKELKENWEKGINGNYQTAHFVSQVLANIDMRHFEKLSKAKSLLDFGCAFGQASIVLSSLFKNLEITCFDTAEVAVDKIKKKQPGFNVTTKKQDANLYDVVYCSNTIEHFSSINLNDFEAKEMLIILVPYDQNLQGWPGDLEPKEGEKPGGHEITFSRKNFPKTIGKLERTMFKPIRETVKNMGTGDQLLVVYEKYDEIAEKDIEFEKKQTNERFEYLGNRLD